MKISSVTQQPLISPHTRSAAQPETEEAKDSFQASSQVTIFPQDPLVGPTEAITLPSEVMGEQLSSPRIRTRDDVPIAIADPDGNYTQYEVGSKEFDQVNAHAVVANTLNMYDTYLGRPANWAFSGPLNVHPHKGRGKTAYYSRWDRSINFFEWNSESLGKRVTTAQSADVIAHEIGHAVWDGIRPRAGYANEAGAFHEAFGDCSALLHALQRPSNLAKALEQNGGDLSQPSLLSRMAEEFGSAFNKEDQDPNNDERIYYRTALNTFKYIDPALLPDDDYPPTVPEEVLTREFHSFSRVWTGTFYNILEGLYDANRAKGAEPLEALTSARDTLGHAWGKALDEMPATGVRYRHAAEAMLMQTLRNNQTDDFLTMGRVLVERNVLSQEQLDSLRDRKLPDIKMGTPEQVLAQASKALDLPDGFTSEGPATMTRDGRTVMLFTAPERHTLPQLECEGDRLEVELHHGLMVAFDADGKLLNLQHTPVDDTRRQEAETFVADLEKSGRLTGNIFKSVDDKNRPFLARAHPERPGVRLVERLPIYD